MEKRKTIIRKALAIFAWPGTECIRMARGPGVRILMYHRVTDESEDRLAVSPPEFKRQMDHLVSVGYRVMTLEQALTAGRERRRLPDVVITFDDGYQDFYRNVFPILRDRKFSAVIFVLPDFIDGKITLPRYRHLKGDSRSVTWEMLREMQEGGITVGAHSVTHRELTGLDSREVKLEIEGSADIIEKQSGIRPKWFSYPRGKYSPIISRMVQDSGYRGAVSVRPGTNRRPYDYFTLRRTEISRDDDLRAFRMKLSGAYDIQHYLWQKLMGKRL
jgi:peptidoglycan/xylan/chitin deacetylase (PgdA/CDA1 family)